MAEDATNNQPAQTHLGDASLPKTNEASSLNTHLNALSKGNLSNGNADDSLFTPQNNRLEVEWFKEIKEKRILHRWLLGTSLAFVIVGTGIITTALFLGSSIISFQAAGGFFSEIIGGTIILFWRGSVADNTTRWQQLNRLYEYNNLINGINGMISRIKNNNARDQFIIEKGGELFDALIDVIKKQSE